MRSLGDIVVYPWIRNGQPTTNVLFQQVTCEAISAQYIQKRQYQHVTNVRAGILELPVPKVKSDVLLRKYGRHTEDLLDIVV